MKPSQATPAPASAQPARPLVQDVARPAPAGQPPSSQQAGVLTPTIVSNIAVKSQNSGTGQPDDDAELDKIMQDVGQELKKSDKKPAKQHFFSRKSHSKSKPAGVVKVAAKVQAQPLPPQPATLPPAPQAQPQAAAAPKPAPAKPKSRVPALTIFMTLVITSALIAAAVYAYK